jgi:hypothetical protein
MKRVMLSALLFFGCLTASAAPSKAPLSFSNGGGMKESILQTKSNKMMFYRAEDEAVLLDGQGASKVGTPMRPSGYRLVTGNAAAIKEKLDEASSPYRRVFYTSFIKSDRNRYVETGNILVKLAEGVRADDFAAAHNLSLLKAVDGQSRLYLFAPGSRQDIIGQSNSLNKTSGVEYASPEWIKPILLR